MSITLTEQMSLQLANITQTPGVLTAEFSEVTSNLLIPSIVTNPLMLTVTLDNSIAANTSTVKIIVPDVLYNSDTTMPVPIEQWKYIANYNDIGCTDDGCIVCPPELLHWLHPTTARFIPFMGINYEPSDVTTLHQNLQSLITQAKELSNVTDILMYEFIDPVYLTGFNSEQAYKMYVYFGNTREYDGKDNISFIVRKETYEDADNIANILTNIDILLKEAILQQGTP